jgi:serine/threonine-protein kinase
VIHEHLADDPGMVRRFQEEARVASQLQHPNIAPVHELGEIPEAPPRPYFTMKLIEGRTLTEAIREYHAVPNDQGRETLLRYFVAVCNAVDYAHSRQILHCDLKPLNVMVGAYGEVQVMDWGLSKTLASPPHTEPASTGDVRPGAEDADERPWRGLTGSVEGAVRGTWSYMPPEQAAGKGVGPWSDVFGLGAILCEILTGQPPYLGSSRSEVAEKARSGDLKEGHSRLERSGEPAEVVASARHCLQARVEDRPASAGAVARAVTDYMADRERLRREAELAAARAEVQAAEERKRRRVQLGLAAAVFLLVTGALGVGLWSRYTAERSARILAARKAEALQRLIPALEESRSLRARHRWAEALAAARKAEVLARDDRIDLDRRREAQSLVADLERDVAEDQRDRQLLVRSFDAVGLDETTLTNPAATGQGPRYDTKLASLFREYGIDLDSMSDDAIVARVNRRPVEVRLDVASVIDLWAFGDRDARRPVALWQRLYGLARRIDPDLQHAELRTILAGQQALPGLEALLAPVTLAFTGSDHNKLLEFSKSLDPSQTPSHTIRLVSLGLITVNETERALGLLREATQARPDDPNLHSWLAALLIIQVPTRWQEAIPVLQTVRALRRDSGGVLAALLARAGRFEEALQVCADLIHQKPDSGWPHAFRSLVLLQQRKHEEAAACDEALKREPRLAFAYSVKSAVRMRQSRFAEAEAAAREAVRSEPSSGLALSNLGMTLFNQNRFDEALAALEKALQFEPNAALIHTNRGAVLTRLLRKDEGIAAARTGLRLDPENPEVLLGLASILGAVREEYGEAEQLARKAVQLQARSPEAHAALGRILAYQKRASDGEKECREAIRLDPGLTLGHDGLAECLVEQRRFKEAEAAVREELRLDKDSFYGHANLGAVLYKQNRYTEAEAELSAALRLDPRAGLVLSNHASVLLKLARNVEAEKEAVEAARLAPESGQVQNQLGKVLQRRGKIVAATDAFRKAVALKPTDAFFHYGLGACLLTRKMLDESLVCFQKATDLAPEDADIRFHVGCRLEEVGCFDEAEKALREAMRIKPSMVTPYEVLGNMMEKRGRVEEARRVFKEASRAKPENDRQCLILGQIYSRLGDAKREEELYQKALAFNPRSMSAHVKLAGVRRQAGDEKEALAILTRALDLEPRESSSLVFLGIQFKLLRQWQTAADVYLKAIRRIGSDPSKDDRVTRADAYSGLGDCLKGLGRPEEAVDAYSKATVDAPEDELVWAALGNTLSDLGRFSEAVEAYRTAIRVSPNFAVAYSFLGYALLQAGRPFEAIDIFQRLVALKPDEFDGYFRLGYSLVEIGESVDAVKALKRAVALDPKSGASRALMGAALRQIGRCDEALEFLVNTEDFQPRSFRALWERAALRAEAGDLSAAKADAEAALTMWPKEHPMRPEVQSSLDDLNRLSTLMTRKADILADRLKPESAAQNFLFARIAAAQQDHRAAVRFYERALAGGAAGGDEFSLSPRVAAARQVLMAADDRQREPSAAQDEDRTALRARARCWLEEEVALLRVALGSSQPLARARVHRIMRICQLNSDFAPVRDDGGLANMKEDERAAWKALWKSIEATRKAARESATK